MPRSCRVAAEGPRVSVGLGKKNPQSGAANVCLSPPVYSSKSASHRFNSTGFHSLADTDRTVSGGSSVPLVYLRSTGDSRDQTNSGISVRIRSESNMSALETLDRVELCESLLTWVSESVDLSVPW